MFKFGDKIILNNKIRGIFIKYKKYKKTAPIVYLNAGDRCLILVLNPRLEQGFSIIIVFESQIKGGWKDE